LFGRSKALYPRFDGASGSQPDLDRSSLTACVYPRYPPPISGLKSRLPIDNPGVWLVSGVGRAFERSRWGGGRFACVEVEMVVLS
ncbi:MAG: hypothetical protein ABSH52_35295, partial [Terriglobia bacterium]